MSKLFNKIYFKGLRVKKNVTELLKNESGEANIIAIILILAIVIALAIIFRSQLTALFNKIWDSLFKNVDNALGTSSVS